MTARRYLLLMLLAALATILALMVLDPTADLPSGVPIEPTPCLDAFNPECAIPYEPGP